MTDGIFEALAETMLKYARKTAVTDGNSALPFENLWSEAQRIGSYWIQNGYAHRRVALLLGRTPHTVAAMLGAVLADVCYVPLNPEAPMPYLLSVCRKAEVDGVLTTEAEAKKGERLIEECPSAQVLLWENAVVCSIDSAALQKADGERKDTDPLYIVFTSGSTGTPKGVIATLRNVLDYGQALAETLPFSDTTVFGCQSPLWMDAPLKELLTMLWKGATVDLLPPVFFSFPPLLFAEMKKNGVNTLCCVSSLLQIWDALGVPDDMPPAFLRCIVFGSEVLAPAVLSHLQEALPQTDFWQLYGPTECTGMSCYYHVDPTIEYGEKIPIGRPFPRTKVFLLDETGALLVPTAGKISAVGEIYLGGDCVTAGYVNDSALTEQAFVSLPLSAVRVYKTGDLACFDGQGQLLFCGRKDDVIKRMGTRIEPQEIENAAARLPQIGEVLCVGIPTASGTRVALCYTGTAPKEDVEKALKERLPHAQNPDWICPIPAIPRTESGKKSRRKTAELVQNMRKETN